MAQTIRLRRGLHSARPNTGLSIGEPLYTTDRYNVYIADSTTTFKPLTPNIDDLVALTGAGVVTANDTLMIHDADAVGHKEKKITVAELKTSLNIPAASTDELVAATVGGTAGYLSDVVAGESGVISVTSINAGEDLEWAIVAGGIGTVKLADSAVTAVKLATGAVTTVKILDANVTTAKIADDAVTTAKLANTALNLGAVFSGTGVDTALTVAALGITNGMLSATALNLNGTTFSGNGTTTTLDVAVIDGGSF